MEASRRPEAADPEFDPSPAPPSRLRDFDPPEHQRLVVNPFLAVLGLIGLIRLARALVASPYPGSAFVLLIPLGLLPQLIQYHCLDCGRTEPYPRHWAHACAGVLARWREGRRRSLPFPTPRDQVIVWGWVLGAVAVLLALVAST